MLLLELMDPQTRITDCVRRGYQNIKQDNSRTSLGGLRKTRLTLAQLRHLRVWTDARNADYRYKIEHLRKQYVFIPPKGAS